MLVYLVLSHFISLKFIYRIGIGKGRHRVDVSDSSRASSRDSTTAGLLSRYCVWIPFEVTTLCRVAARSSSRHPSMEVAAPLRLPTWRLPLPQPSTLQRLQRRHPCRSPPTPSFALCARVSEMRKDTIFSVWRSMRALCVVFGGGGWGGGGVFMHRHAGAN